MYMVFFLSDTSSADLVPIWKSFRIWSVYFLLDPGILVQNPRPSASHRCHEGLVKAQAVGGRGDFTMSSPGTCTPRLMCRRDAAPLNRKCSSLACRCSFSEHHVNPTRMRAMMPEAVSPLNIVLKDTGGTLRI